MNTTIAHDPHPAWQDLTAHFAATGQRPAQLSVADILYLEQSGAIVDLTTGRHWVPVVDYLDFARRWGDYRRHIRRPVTADALFRALMAAFDNPFDYPEDLWHTIAQKTLPAARDGRRAHKVAA